MFAFLKKIFGTHQTRLIKKYRKIVDKVNNQEIEYQKLSLDELKLKTEEFKKRYQQGETLDDLLVEAYAAVKNVCRRLVGTDVHVSGYEQKWDMIPYDVQIIGAIAMHNRAIAEMQTGEGKTLTASMPLYLNALTGKPVHLVTVNDYLCKRDCEWIGSIFRNLGLSVAYLTNDTPYHKKKEVYLNDIVYGTASEFGFDYLRDNSMAMQKEQLVQRGHFFAIIDEIDSILIDEARTPLIISGPTNESRQMYEELKDGVSFLVKAQRDLCSRFATDAKKELEVIGCLSEEEPKKLSKEEQEKKEAAFKKFWLVNKGVPRNKVLKRIRENPDFRAEIDKWEVYFHSDANKEEKHQLLSELFIIVDERANEYELTDKGILSWTTHIENQGEHDFVMLDLGYEYSKIDQDPTLSEQLKMEQKNQLSLIDANRKERSHNLRQLFRAHLLLEKDVDYIVQEGAIIIIDENTGRPQPGRRFSDGLHQAIEAKESLKIQGETQTYATITLQNYFKMHEKLAGMTGTAITEAGEFKEIYKLEVLQIPTHVLCQRKDTDDEIYMTEREKYHAILKEIEKEHQKGRPILIGTESVEVSEKLSRILKQNNLKHTVLNAKNHAKEAEIIAEAGNVGAITLATNMAGRGTDIKLKNTKELGGLHVIGSTRHHSRRIDRQLRGRSGRLGDPGSSKFFVSFEDSLMRLFASPRMTALLQRFRPPEGEPISAKVLNKSIETAQKRVEQRNFTMRKHTLEYDDVLNKQRSEIYSFRNELLFTDNPIEIAKEMVENLCFLSSEKYLISKSDESSWDLQGYCNYLMSCFPCSFDVQELDSEYETLDQIGKKVADKVLESFEQKLLFETDLIEQYHPRAKDENQAIALLQEVIRNLMLMKIDQLWQQHLLRIDHLKTDVHLQAIAQKDPLIEFKQQAFALFDQFSQNLREEITKGVFRIHFAPPEKRALEETIAHIPQPLHIEKKPSAPLITNVEASKAEEKILLLKDKVGRNELCACGSGKKSKRCCGAKVSEETV